MKLTLKIRRYF